MSFPVFIQRVKERRKYDTWGGRWNGNWSPLKMFASWNEREDFWAQLQAYLKKTGRRVSKKGKHLKCDCMVTQLVNWIQRVRVEFNWFSISTNECSWNWSLSSFFPGQCLILCCWALNDDIMTETRGEYWRPEELSMSYWRYERFILEKLFSSTPLKGHCSYSFSKASVLSIITHSIQSVEHNSFIIIISLFQLFW